MMDQALEAIASGTSIRATSKLYSIPRGTLQDRLHQRVENGYILGRPTQLTPTDEVKLVDFAENRAAAGIGLTAKHSYGKNDMFLCNFFLGEFFSILMEKTWHFTHLLRLNPPKPSGLS
jgi:hypothetical protein